MPATFSQGFWQRVHGWLGSQPHHGCDDAQLLDRFVATKDEAAFQTLLERHGPMVWSVCRRVLRHAQDAEDAFQATFLVLVRRADAIRKLGSVGSWLHGVALRTAQKARVQASRRQAREIHVTFDAPTAEAAFAEQNPVLEEELARLPDKYRLPLVLCYYQGQTLEGAAQSLGWPLGTVAGRMSRAREQLRLRLEKRGVALTAAAVVATMVERAATALHPNLSQQTLQTCLAWLSPEKAVPASMLSLSQGVIQAMFWSKMKLASLVVLGLALLVVSGGLLWSQVGTSDAGTGSLRLIPRSQDKAAPGTSPQPGKRSPKWTELAKKKYLAAQSEWKLRTQEFREGGKTSLVQLLDCSRRLWEARRDHVTNKEELLKGMREHLAELVEMEKRTELMYTAGRTPRQDFDWIEYAVLDLRMRLLEEEGG